MNREKRKELRQLNKELRSILKRVRSLKYAEGADFTARCPNGTDYYPSSVKILGNAETSLKEAITWVERAEQASPGWTLSVYDMQRKVAI